jgi:short-subunit dehydrogenase
MTEIWLVLGGSSPIARAFARHAVACGDRVILAGRDRADLEASAADLGVRGGATVPVLDCDARDHARHADVVAQALHLAGSSPLGVFVAFGDMPDQSAAEHNWDTSWRTLDVNFVGVVSLLNRFALEAETRRTGRVVVITSVAGDRGRLKNYIYGAAKAGLATYLEGLRARLHRAGIPVTTVKPGFVDTAMTWGMSGLFLVASPETAARICYSASKKGRDVVYAPRFWWIIMTIIRHIPERIFKKLDI